jgi:HK97 family phage prohead protease
MNEDFLVVGGSALKALSDGGKFGGFLVLFNDVDLEGERFTSETDFWLAGKSLLPLLYDHGRSRVFGKKKLTHVCHDVQPQGLWVEGRLPLGDGPEVEQLWHSVKSDQLGLSSGSSSHLVEKRRAGDAVEILSWPISEASLAPMPAQPRSRAMALKSLPPAEFEFSLRKENLSPERQAMSAAVEFERIRFKSITGRHVSLDDEAREEMRAYYSALAEIQLARLR